MPLRVAVTGQVEGRELGKVLPILGKEFALERIDRVIANYKLLS
jgi:glutamyl/glutaminyl-tRNA synthetase